MPKKKIEQKEAEVVVTNTILDKQNTKKKRIKIRPFVTTPATVGVKFGATIPTVDYGGVRVDVSVDCPCYVEEMLDVYKQVHRLADELIEKEVEYLTGKGLEDR